MTDPIPVRRYRFGVFEADLATGELRRQGVRIKLNAQPFQVLCLLLGRPGELLTREEISRELWPDGTFVDYEHGVNAAINRIREALGDSAANPRFVETLARREYRFVAPVAPVLSQAKQAGLPVSPIVVEPGAVPPDQAQADPPLISRILASPEDLPKTSHSVVRSLFLLLQVMYVAFYVGALANLAEIEDLFSPLAYAAQAFVVLIATAAVLIPLRAFLVCAVLFRAPRAREKFLKLWPALLVVDVMWSLSPFLLLHHINYGLALACTTLLVYSPFAQRALVIMGAADMESPLGG